MKQEIMIINNKSGRSKWSGEAKGLHSRFVQNHMNPVFYGLKNELGDVVRPNVRSKHWPVPVTATDIFDRPVTFHTQRVLSKPLIESHLCSSHQTVYFENSQFLKNGKEVFLHPVAVDIDSDCDLQAAHEIRALIELWLADNGINSPTISIPSPSGHGIHLWLMFRRSKKTSPQKFNKVLENIGRALRQQIPYRPGDRAWLCKSDNPIKGTLTYMTPNKQFKPALAVQPGAWRRATKRDLLDDIIPTHIEDVVVSDRHNTKTYADQDRVYENEKCENVVVTGPVEQTQLQAYERSRSFEGFERDSKLEPFDLHRGSLIAFPGAGRKDLVPQLLAWYDKAILAPINMAAAMRLAQQASGKEVMSATYDFFLRTAKGRSRSWKILTSTKKPDSMLAAAQVALQQYGMSAMVEDVLNFYEQFGPATGPRDRKRVSRARCALNKALQSYDPNIRNNLKNTSDECPQPQFGNQEIQELVELMKQSWPDLSVLKSSARGRNVTYEQMAFVFACLAKYLLVNWGGRVSGQAVRKTAQMFNLSLHKDVYRAIRDGLIDAGWLVVTDNSYSHTHRRSKAYALGVNVPRLRWLEGFDMQHPLSSGPSMPAPPIDLELGKVLQWGDTVLNLAFFVDSERYVEDVSGLDPLWSEAWAIYNDFHSSIPALNPQNMM